MPDPKQKARSLTRAPKPKKTLGLSLPVPLRLPHEDLIKTDLLLTNTEGEREKKAALSQYSSTGVPEYSNTTTTNQLLINQQISETFIPEVEQKPKTEIRNSEQKAPETRNQNVGPQTNFYRKPNNTADQLDRTLTPAESKIYDHLFRLSIGFNKDSCQVRISTLQERTGYRSDKTIREALNGLVAKGLISKRSTQNSPLGDHYWITNSPKNLLSNPTESEINLIENQINLIRKEINKEINSTEKIDNFNSNNTETPVLRYSSTAVKNTAVLESKITGHLNTIKKDHDDDCPLVAQIRSIFPKIEDEKIFQTKQEILAIIANTIATRVQRAKIPPVNPAYIVEIVYNLCATPDKKNNIARQKMEKIISQVRSTYIGSQLPISELTARVKDICAKEETIFDPELFNEIINRKT